MALATGLLQLNSQLARTLPAPTTPPTAAAVASSTVSAQIAAESHLLFTGFREASSLCFRDSASSTGFSSHYSCSGLVLIPATHNDNDFFSPLTAQNKSRKSFGAGSIRFGVIFFGFMEWEKLGTSRHKLAGRLQVRVLVNVCFLSAQRWIPQLYVPSVDFAFCGLGFGRGATVAVILLYSKAIVIQYLKKYIAKVFLF